MSPTAGELICEIALAISQKVKLPKLASVMHAYPTYALPIQSPLAKDVYYESLRGYGPILNVIAKIPGLKLPF